MHQIRKTIELFSKGVSRRQIAIITGISRKTTKNYVRAAEGSGVAITALLEMDDPGLFAALKLEVKQVAQDPRHADFEDRILYFLGELRKTGVTMQLLWEEYRAEFSEGYGYTQFCHYLGLAKGKTDLSMHMEHKPGAMMMFDFAGEKLSYVDRETGEIIYCQVLVCVLPYSGYGSVEALPSQKQVDLIHGLDDALLFIGGVPQSLKSDNMPALVKKACRYEPKFTESMEYFGDHYGTTLMAARAGKPKDKPHVENMVLTTYRRVYAPLRNETFYSLADLNAAIRAKVEAHHAKHFQKFKISRKELFETEEKPLLKALPSSPYEHRHVTMAKVQKDYHVMLGEDKHLYSVPYRLVGKQMKIVYGSRIVEIYDGIERIALHDRDRRPHKHSTEPSHRPPNHQHYAEQLGWDADYFLSWARRIGPFTHAAITHVLKSQNFPEQSFRSCMGILRLGSDGQEKRLEAACLRLKDSPRINYGILRNILKNGLDKAPTLFDQPLPVSVQHENLRGPAAYQ
jgi:transposase